MTKTSIIGKTMTSMLPVPFNYFFLEDIDRFKNEELMFSIDEKVTYIVDGKRNIVKVRYILERIQAPNQSMLL
jgi:hypothetical protein